MPLVRQLPSKLLGAAMAERQGFEPWVDLRPQRFSRPPRSTTPAPLRGGRALVAKGVSDGDARIETLQSLNEAVDSDDNSVRAVQEIQVRFLMAASNAGILEQELDEGALRAALKAGEAEMRMSMKAAGLAAAAYTYQDFTDEDLQDYVEALEHPDMQTVYQLMNAVQYEIMANRFEVLASRMAEMHPGQEL
jgi:hypothetical protein